MTQEEHISQLVTDTLEGNSSAFGEIVILCQDRLYNAMLRVTGSTTQAEEYTQEAFVRAYLKLRTFQGKANFYTWLYRIALNVAFSEQRKRKPASLDERRQRIGGEPLDQGDRPSQMMERKECVAEVQRAILELNQEHQAVIVLREFEGLDYRAIGDVLGVDVGTVRSRLYRARQRLMGALGMMHSP